MTTTIDLSISEGVATVTLVPAASGKPPTLDHPVLDRIEAVIGRLAEAAREGSLRLAFLRSASPKFFCVGADVGSLKDLNASSIVPWIQHGHRVFNRLEDLPVPVVARVEGYALGGGLELAMACDAIFASETAQFGQTEAKLGFVSGWGGSWRLPRRVGLARAKVMFFTGQIIAAPEAERIGLVEFCGSSSALEEHCRQFAAEVRAGSEVSHAGHKRLLAASLSASREESAQAEAAESKHCAGSPSTLQRLHEFLAARASRSQAPRS